MFGLERPRLAPLKSSVGSGDTVVGKGKEGELTEFNQQNSTISSYHNISSPHRIHLAFFFWGLKS